MKHKNTYHPITDQRVRLRVHRSLKHVMAYLIDSAGRIIGSASDISKRVSADGSKIEKAYRVGLNIAQIAKNHNITNVRFDRANYKYHGRIKALADGAKESGLNF